MAARAFMWGKRPFRACLHHYSQFFFERVPLVLGYKMCSCWQKTTDHARIPSTFIGSTMIIVIIKAVAARG